MSEAKGDIQMVFMTLVMIIIGLALTPVVQTTVTSAIGGNMSGTTGATLLALVPLFWVISIIGMGVAAIYYFFR